MNAITELSHEDQIALWAGRVVRKEAQIESTLRTIYYHLSGEGLSWAVVPKNFSPLLSDVRTMLKSAAIDEGYRDDCLIALERLGRAHAQRNRIVHDQWVEQSPGAFVSTPKGVSGPTTKPEVIWDVAEFEGCFVELQFASVQVMGIYWSLPCYIGDHKDFWRDMIPMNREAIAGRIKITNDSGGQVTWEATDPQFIAEQKARHYSQLATVESGLKESDS